MKRWVATSAAASFPDLWRGLLVVRRGRFMEVLAAARNY